MIPKDLFPEELDVVVQVALHCMERGSVSVALDICFEYMDTPGMTLGDYAAFARILRQQNSPERALRLYSRCLDSVKEPKQRQYLFGEMGLCHEQVAEKEAGQGTRVMENYRLAALHLREALHPLRYPGQLEFLVHLINVELELGEFRKADAQLRYVDSAGLSHEMGLPDLHQKLRHVRGKYVYLTGRVPGG